MSKKIFFKPWAVITASIILIIAAFLAYLYLFPSVYTFNSNFGTTGIYKIKFPKIYLNSMQINDRTLYIMDSGLSSIQLMLNLNNKYPIDHSTGDGLRIFYIDRACVLNKETVIKYQDFKFAEDARFCKPIFNSISEAGLKDDIKIKPHNGNYIVVTYPSQKAKKYQKVINSIEFVGEEIYGRE
jgi:hypothetical protein